MGTLLQKELCITSCNFQRAGGSDARFLHIGFFQGQGPSDAVCEAIATYGGSLFEADRQ